MEAPRAHRDALAPRLVVSFRGSLLGAVVLGDRALCLVQDFYFAHWKDVWLFEHALEDGALRGAILLRHAHDHGPAWTPFDAAGDVVLTPEARRISTGAPIALRHGAAASTHRPRVALVLAGGGRVLVHERAEVLALHDVATGARVSEVRERMGPIQCAAVDASGTRLAVATSSRLRLWDLERGAAVCSLGDVSGRTRSLTFRPDGRSLVSCEPGGTVRAWPLRPGGRRGPLPLLADRVVFDATGERFAAVTLEPDRERPGHFAAAVGTFDTRARASLLRGDPMGSYALDPRAGVAPSLPRAVCLTVGGGVVVQEESALSVFERAEGDAAAAAPLAFDADEDIEGDERERWRALGGTDGLATFGSPVAVWRAGESTMRRFTSAELAAAWRNRAP